MVLLLMKQTDWSVCNRPFGLVQGGMPKNGAVNRERILDAAQHLVIENGFAATSVDQVLRAAGTSKGGFFHHFDSKLDLARALTPRSGSWRSSGTSRTRPRSSCPRRATASTSRC